MSRLVLCEAVNGTGDYVGFSNGIKNAIQVYATGSVSATLYASLLNNDQYAPILTITTSELYTFDALTDAKFKLTITTNLATVTAVVA